MQRPTEPGPSIESTSGSEVARAARKIVIGFEPTDQGADAVALGEVLAEVLDANPIVARVMVWPRYLMGADDLETALAAETKPAFAALREQLQALKPETRALANPSPAEALSALAEGDQALLLVIGSTHRSAVGRMLLGSVGESLLHGAPCAVAVAPKGYDERQPRRLLRLGVAFDGSSESWAALETTVALAERLRARLSVFTVADHAHYGYATSLSIPTEGEIVDHELTEKQRILDLGLKRVPSALPVEGRLLRGSAAPALSGAASDVDLLLMGSRSYGPLRRTLLGSVAAAVIRSAPCPILVLPRATTMDPLGVGGHDSGAAAG